MAEDMVETGQDSAAEEVQEDMAEVPAVDSDRDFQKAEKIDTEEANILPVQEKTGTAVKEDLSETDQAPAPEKTDTADQVPETVSDEEKTDSTATAKEAEEICLETDKNYLSKEYI